VRRAGVWPTESSWAGANSLMGGPLASAAPVFGSLVWAAPAPVPKRAGRSAAADRAPARREYGSAPLDQGLWPATGPSSQAARFWSQGSGPDSAERGLPAPGLPRGVAIPGGAMA